MSFSWMGAAGGADVVGVSEGVGAGELVGEGLGLAGDVAAAWVMGLGCTAGDGDWVVVGVVLAQPTRRMTPMSEMVTRRTKKFFVFIFPSL